MRALGIIGVAAAVAFVIDQEYYNGQYWRAISSMLRHIARSWWR
jgi:hypothetical protein